MVTAYNIQTMREQQQLQEGFYDNQPVIEQNINYRHHFHIRPADQQPRVLKNQPIHTKLPIQILSSFSSLTSSPEQQDNFPFKYLEKELPQTPYQKYEMNSATYKLIYSKTDKSPFHSSILRQRQVNQAHSLERYDQHNFSILKSYESNQQNTDVKTNKLQFDSKFECGNLLCVYQQLKSTHNYHCFIENDTNTKGYNQWFYFSMKGIQKNIIYRFHIMNFKKKFSFFKVGMKPVMFSLRQQRETGNGWMRKGQHLTYQPSAVYDIQKGKEIRLYSLYFETSFDFDDDFITISSALPYSYSRLTNHLNKCEQIAKSSELLWKQRTIAYSLSNNQIPYISISNPLPPTKEQSKVKKRKKRLLSNDDEIQQKIIILLARQHPGESQSSFLMQQLLYWLAKNDTVQVKWLLSRYQFRIFPMVNVDGVIYGNFRTDIAGYDLNRVWKNPIKDLHPQVYAIKSQIQKLNSTAKIVGCFDLHSHSKQFNIFSYCCKQDEIQSRLLSYMLSKDNPLFHFPFCTFGLSKQKQSTARASIFSIINNPNVITIQCSAYASNKQKVISLQPKELKSMAWTMLASMKSYYARDQFALDSLAQITNNLTELLSLSNINWEEVSGSDSDPQGDEQHSQTKLKQILPSSLFRTIEKNKKETELLDQQIDNQQLRKTIQRYRSIEEPEQSMTNSHSCKIIPKFQPQKREFKKRELKHSIIAPCELPQRPEATIDHQIIIELPMEKWKDNHLSGTQKMKTEPKREPISNLSTYEDGTIQRKVHKLGIIARPFKNSMKQLYAGISHKQSVHLSPDQKIRIGPKMDEKLQTKQSMLKKLSSLSKIIVVRKRTKTLKTMTKEAINLSEEECALLQIRSANKTIENNKVRERSQDFKNNTKHMSEFINVKKQISPKNQDKECSQTKNNGKTRIKNPVNASLLSQVWRHNYGKYSKDLH